MLRKILTFTICIGLAFFIVNCANHGLKSHHSGFLKSYEGLETNDNYEGAMIRVMPDADFSKYENMYVSPVQIYTGVPEGEQTPEQKLLYKQMSEYLTEGYKKNIRNSKEFNLVETPGDKTLKFEVAISAVEVNFDDIQLYQLTPVTLGLTVAARSTYVDRSVRILGEGRLADAQTGKVLMRGMTLQKGDEVGTDADHLVFSDVKSALDTWLKSSINNIAHFRKTQNQ